jgi:hypothetical protein
MYVYTLIVIFLNYLFYRVRPIIKWVDKFPSSSEKYSRAPCKTAHPLTPFILRKLTFGLPKGNSLYLLSYNIKASSRFVHLVVTRRVARRNPLVVVFIGWLRWCYHTCYFLQNMCIFGLCLVAQCYRTSFSTFFEDMSTSVPSCTCILSSHCFYD